MIAQIRVPVKGRSEVAEQRFGWSEGVRIATYFTFRGSEISFAIGFLVTIIFINQKLSVGYKIMEIMSTPTENTPIYRVKSHKIVVYLVKK